MPGPSVKPSPRPRPGASGRQTSTTDVSTPTPDAAAPEALSHPSSDAARLRRLIEAQAVINSDLSLSDMLERIIRTACELVGARYGALGVIGQDGTLESLVQHGLDEATVAAMGPLPVLRHGLLGAMIDDPSPVRVDDIAADPRATGFPPNHPPMSTFLGVPIRVRGEVFGDIYLSEAADGRFTADDEELVAALASTAGTAIANARLYEDARRTRDWLRASGDVTRALLAEADVDSLLEVISQALEVAEADYGAVILPDPSGKKWKVTIAVGVGAEHVIGKSYTPSASQLGQLLKNGGSALIADLDAALEGEHSNPFDFGPGIIAALVDAKGPRGSVMLMRRRGRPQFTDRDLELASAFADQIALALEMNDARDDAEWLRALEVRHQIAQDLHDNVIQRLFATGMGLHSITDADLPAATAKRLARYVGELDETIDEIRERVFGLREDSQPKGRARGRFPRIGPFA